MTQDIKQEVTTVIDEYVQELVGDTPVSCQINAAIGDAAKSAHEHSNYVTRDEYEALERQVESLMILVGDTPVAEQISVALKK